MNGWKFDIQNNEWVNSYNLIRTRINPMIGEPDKYWMNSVEYAHIPYNKETSKSIEGLGILIGINWHWPSVQNKTAKYSTGYESFDPMI